MNQSERKPNFDDYRSMMSSTHAPAPLREAVLSEAQARRRQTAAAQPSVRAARRPKRALSKGLAAAACLALAVGAGTLGLAFGLPSALERALFSTAGDAPANSFALAAYAAENPENEPGKTVELDSGSFSGGGGYSGNWYNPADQTFWDGTWAGYKFHFPLHCVGNNIETITYEIEGERSYFETIDQRVTPEDVEQGAHVFSYSKNVVFDYEDQRSVSDERIVSLYIGFPLSEEGRRVHEKMLAEGNSEELSRQKAFAIERGAAEEISHSRLKLTATFTDGSTQTKAYVIEPVADFDERYLAYCDAWDAFRAAEEAGGSLSSNSSAEEMNARMSKIPQMPKLYTITELAE